MGALNVAFGVQEEPLLVLAPENVATATANHLGQSDSHPADKTAGAAWFFPQSSPFAASA